MHATLARVRAVLRSDTAVPGVLAPRAGHAISSDRSTAVVVGLAGGTPDEMVRAAGRLKTRVARLSAPGLAVRLTGPAAMWSDFNAANKAAMLKSEMLSWPLTLALLLLAFGTLVAAGLPLLLTMAGLLGAGGLLFLCGQFADVSIWAMNFAMMGVVLAVAVLLDATLIRLLLQPVVLRLLGARAWWMPAWLDRLVPSVGLSHARLEQEAASG